MGIRTRDHQDVVALEAVVPGEDIGRQVGTGDVSDMDFRTGIRPGDGDKNIFGLCHWFRSPQDNCEFYFSVVLPIRKLVGVQSW